VCCIELLLSTSRDEFEDNTCSSSKVVGDPAFMAGVGTITVTVLAMNLASFPSYFHGPKNLD